MANQEETEKKNLELHGEREGLKPNLYGVTYIQAGCESFHNEDHKYTFKVVGLHMGKRENKLVVENMRNHKRYVENIWHLPDELIADAKIAKAFINNIEIINDCNGVFKILN